jgi:hypothetical protein
MNFTVHGLSPEPFRSLYGLSDIELAARRARRVVVNGSGFPERIEMRDAQAGETLLLVNFEHQSADTPYRSSHAIYVREGATETWSGDHLPEVMRKRLLSLRAFSADGSMVDADVVEGREAERVIERLLGEERVAYLHAHYAKPGCYAARIDRA